MARERIGIMGGSFNPIHQRHIQIAECALKEARLSQVLVLPTGNPPHKREGLEPASQRFEMARLAVAGRPCFSASRIELDREGVIYTVDTLGILQKKFPGADFFYIIGEDTLLDLPNWKSPDKVFSLCSFLVCRRSSIDIAANPVCLALKARGASVQFLSLPPSSTSSTAIRQALAKGETSPHLAPQVLEYIRMMGLYGLPPSPPEAEAIYPRLRAALTGKRLIHSLLVASTARHLAQRHRLDENAATLAGLLHDCAKCLSLFQMQVIAKNHRMLLDKETLQSPDLLHGPVGAVIAEADYGVTNANVLAAIACHTTGKVGMLPLDMALFWQIRSSPPAGPIPR